LEATLADSWENDYQKLPRLECDFSTDEVLKKRRLKA